MTEPIKSSLDTLLDPESGEWDKQLQEASPEEVKELYYGEASTLDKLSYGFQKQASLLGMGLTAIEAGLNKDKTFFDGKRIRLGGLVENGSINRNGIETIFIITDGNNSIEVQYNGLLPDLFSENQGVIAEGFLIENTFIADTILAKHDENYMPREVAESLKSKGVWKGKP